jgi:hypothetical protein
VCKRGRSFGATCCSINVGIPSIPGAFLEAACLIARAISCSVIGGNSISVGYLYSRRLVRSASGGSRKNACCSRLAFFCEAMANSPLAVLSGSVCARYSPQFLAHLASFHSPAVNAVASWIQILCVTVYPQLASRFSTHLGCVVTYDLSEVCAVLLYVYIACTPPVPPSFYSLEFSSLSIQSICAFQASGIGIRNTICCSECLSD